MLRWLAQAMHWTVCAIVMRGVVILFIWAAHEPLGDIAVYMGSWACSSSQVRAKTFLNIVLWPLVMDMLQVIAQSFALKPPPTEADGEEGEEEGEGGPEEVRTI